MRIFLHWRWVLSVQEREGGADEEERSETDPSWRALDLKARLKEERIS